MVKEDTITKEGTITIVMSDPITDFDKVLERMGITAKDKARIRRMIFGKPAFPTRDLSGVRPPKATPAKETKKKRVRASRLAFPK